MYQIAIDGPSGAGKSTLAKQIAARLGIVYVDTGALYRTVGYYVRSVGADPADRAAVEALLPQIHLKIRYENGAQHVLLNGTDPGDRIRTPEISLAASLVSAIPAVRSFLLEAQKSIARENSVIMDGRDIGTVILPDADVKIFLTASVEARADRRYRELLGRGERVTYDEVLSDMKKRDGNDENREIAPAIPAPDAIRIDNSGLTPEGSVEAILSVIREELAKRGKTL